ncbi:hypothetical protein [Paenibacillus popilliae]|uniref:3-isopropylmalate dehydratase n=1 Tax=Paenibacillus popilliae ATCC 14706 TaxID=1212764 RepID=M9LL28_PAEPP|nr:hypothetical protein [Paenibacillus popilliae]GAC44060.1 3-isopropylmalate dehydratase [Paenibacillus popilliae ATCC 14706]
MSTPKTVAINSSLEIVKMEECRFKALSMLGYYKVSGYAFRHPELGFVSFDGEIPYIPRGGKRTLQSILNDAALSVLTECTGCTNGAKIAPNIGVTDRKSYEKGPVE